MLITICEQEALRELWEEAGMPPDHRPMEMSASPALGARRELERVVTILSPWTRMSGWALSFSSPSGSSEPTSARAQGWQDSGETPADFGISQLRPACAFNHMLLKVCGGKEGVPAQRIPKALSGLQAPGTPAPLPGCPSAGLACCPQEDLPLSFLSEVQQPSPFPV